MNTTVTPANHSLTIVGLACVAIWLASALYASKPEPIDPARVPVIAANRTAIEQCRDQEKCIGGYVQFRGVMAVHRITYSNMALNGEWTVGVVTLVDQTKLYSDAYLDRIQDIVLPNDPRWDDFAKKYARQFVTTAK